MSRMLPFRRLGTQDNPSADHADQLNRSPIIDGAFLEGLSLDGSGAYASFDHPLERAYRGVIITSQSAVQVLITVCHPDDTNVSDATKQFTVRPTGLGQPNIAVTFNCWIF